MGINIIHNQYVTFDELGACCTYPLIGPQCLDLTEESCGSINALTLFQGVGTDCNTALCPPTP
jgi:hypothetical protein